MLYNNSLLLPHINYCLTTWVYQCHKLQKLQKMAIRIITLSKYNDHIAPLFKKLNLLTIKDILALQELNYTINSYTTIYHRTFSSGRLNKILIFTITTHAIKMNFTLLAQHMPSQSSVLNIICPIATPQIVKDKLFTHSFYGFTNYVKYNFIQNYQIICTVTNCYICMRH